jgi:hypothetical protein
MRFNTVPLMSWSPQGDRLAYFVRTEKDRSLLLQNVISRKVEIRIPMTTVDSPESPDISPDGKLVAFAACARHRQRHLHRQSRDEGDRQPHEGRVRRLLADVGARRQVDHLPERVSGNEKLFRLDWQPANPHSSPSVRTTRAAAQFSTPTRWSSPRRRLIRPRRSMPTSPRTAPSTTCGR